MQAGSFSTLNSINSVKESNSAISSNLPNSDFFETYHQAYEHYAHKPNSFTHIVTSCTPARGLAYFDKINDVETFKYLNENYQDEMVWLEQYKYSFSFLKKFRELNNNIKFIIYSGVGYSTKPENTTFGNCLLHFTKNYEYVSKTNDYEEDANKIKHYLKDLNHITTVNYTSDGFLIFDQYLEQGLVSILNNDQISDLHIFIKSAKDYHKKIVLDFDYLIRSKSPEYEIDCFLRQHPELLLETQYSKDLIIQPFLEGSEYYNKRPDMLLRPLINTIPAKIVELKRPDAKIIKNENKDLTFSNKLFDAVNQIRRYQEYFNNVENINKFNNKYGIKVIKPTARLIIGNNFGNSSSSDILFQKDQLFSQKIEVITYEELLQLVKINRGFYF